MSYFRLLIGVIGFLCVVSIEAQTAAMFDFDNATPALATGKNVPFDQSTGAVTAHFSSPQGGVFSVQNDANTMFTLSQFFGNYLYPNRNCADSLNVQFGQPLTDITLTFATTDHPPIEIPNEIQLTAYAGSNVVGAPVNARAVYGSDTFPMGTIAFSSSGVPFNLVKIALVLPGNTPTGFIIDNIAVTAVTIPQLNIVAAAPGSVVLSWAAPCPGFVLQQNLTCTNSWVDATNIVETVGNRNQVTISPSEGSRFYRLFHR